MTDHRPPHDDVTRSDRGDPALAGDLDAELAATEGIFGGLIPHPDEVPADLTQRAIEGASRSLLDRSPLGLVADLLGVGVEAIRVLLDDGARSER